MERKNGLVNRKVVEASPVRGTGGDVVAPTHVFVRLGPEQRVRVPVPMSSQTLRLLASVEKAKK